MLKHKATGEETFQYTSQTRQLLNAARGYECDALNDEVDVALLKNRNLRQR